MFVPISTPLWRRKWHLTPVLFTGKSHGRRSLVGYSRWDCEQLDTTERLHLHFSLSCIGERNANPLQYSCLENPRNGGAWWAAFYGVTQSREWLKRLSSSSSSHSLDGSLVIDSVLCLGLVLYVVVIQLLGHVWLFWPHELQHTRLPYPSPSPGACSDSCPLNLWCYTTISYSVVLFSSCLQSFQASGSFPMTQFFASGGQSTGVSTSASVLPKDIQDWFPLGLTGLLSLQSKGLSNIFSNTTVQKINSLLISLVYGPMRTSIPDHWKNHSFD